MIQNWRNASHFYSSLTCLHNLSLGHLENILQNLSHIVLNVKGAGIFFDLSPFLLPKRLARETLAERTGCGNTMVCHVLPISHGAAWVYTHLLIISLKYADINLWGDRERMLEMLNFNLESLLLSYNDDLWTQFLHFS